MQYNVVATLRMVTDIVLDGPENRHRTIVDTKFTSIVRPTRFAESRLKSEYLYQMYTYLRSQEGRSPLWDRAGGLFLHPATDTTIHERVVIQNHALTFATVDLSRTVAEIRNELRCILLGEGDPASLVCSHLDRLGLLLYS